MPPQQRSRLQTASTAAGLQSLQGWSPCPAASLPSLPGLQLPHLCLQHPVASGSAAEPCSGPRSLRSQWHLDAWLQEQALQEWAHWG